MSLSLKKIVPAVLLALSVLTFALTPPSRTGWAICAGTLLLGILLGWLRGRAMRITLDPVTHRLNHKASPLAMLILLLLIAGKAAVLVMPFAYKAVVDGMSADRQAAGAVLMLVVAYAAARFGGVLADNLRNAVFEKVGQQAGRRLAARLGRPFLDADTEIEAAAALPITEIFARYGETHFRDGERRVITRLLSGPEPVVLATGGGAFAHARTRAAIAAMPDGRHEAAEALEGDGLTGDDLWIRVAVTIDGDALTVDFTGTDPAGPGNCNCPPAVTRSAVFLLSPVNSTGVRPNPRSSRIASGLVGLTVSRTTSVARGSPSQLTVISPFVRPTSTSWPSTRPTTPTPGRFANASTGGSNPTSALAVLATAWAMGCSE